MSYEVAIASFGGDEITLTKSFIISLKNIAANWYARLPLRSITSWAQLKEKFLVNFQGFEADVNTEKDFFLLSVIRKRDIARLLSHVPSAQSTSPGDLR
jgi:hypothetical protein